MLRWLTVLLLLLSSASVTRARDLELALSRLSRGDCAATLPGAPLRLATDGAPTLRPDQQAFRRVVAQLAGALGPVELSPVIGSGPGGLDVSLQTTVSGLARDASWARASQGGEAATCDARDGAPPRRLTSERLRVEKGLPFGVTVGAAVAHVFANELFLVGADVKVALLEEVSGSRVPDLALRIAGTRLLGAAEVGLSVLSFSLLLSESWLLGKLVAIAPYVGGEIVWTRATSETVDLTPNIDALACAAGADAVCNAGGLGASADDLGHDVHFEPVSQLRYRGVLGLALRIRRVSLSSSLALDVMPPHIGQRGQGETLPRQWTASVAPMFTF